MIELLEKMLSIVNEEDEIPVEEKDPLVEKVAALAHDQWMKWAKDILETETISKERADRWKEECFKPYEELTEEMKEFDRQWARKYITLIQSGKIEESIGKVKWM
jgi:hypothetical protein